MGAPIPQGRRGIPAAVKMKDSQSTPTASVHRTVSGSVTSQFIDGLYVIQCGYNLSETGIEEEGYEHRNTYDVHFLILIDLYVNLKANLTGLTLLRFTMCGRFL